MDASTIVDETAVRAAGGRPHGSRLVSIAAVAAWGAGLILLALGAGTVTARSSAAAVGIVLMVLGVSGIAGGALALARGRIVVPRAGVLAALAMLLTGTAALAIDPARVSVAALAAASVLAVVYAVVCAVAMRARTPRRDAASLLTLLIAGVVVAAIVTPALSATEAALLAPRDGQPAIMVDPHRH